MKKKFLVMLTIILLNSVAYGQDTQELIGQISKVYTGSEVSGSNIIAGFSVGGLIGGMLFGGIGFVAFIYGKKNSEFRPMIMGILLMVFPYFLKNTMAMYLVGIALTVGLYVWRE